MESIGDNATLRPDESEILTDEIMPDGSEFGQYKIISLLGRGGMGEVYEAKHTVLGRSFALKLLPSVFSEHPRALRRFQDEARVMSNLKHPAIVSVDEFGCTDNRYWLRMELVDGVQCGDVTAVTLADLLNVRGGKLTADEFKPLLINILEGLDHAHSEGVTHRDLKPSNILLQGKQARISDFGLARLVEENQDELSLGSLVTMNKDGSTGTTRAGALVGTYDFMSPEQKRGEQADSRSDVYAIGLIIYRCLTGKGLGMKKPSDIVPGLDKRWDDIAEKALEEEAADRYSDAGELLQAVLSVGETTPAAAIPDASPSVKKKKRSIWPILFLILLVPLIFFILAMFFAVRTPVPDPGPRVSAQPYQEPAPVEVKPVTMQPAKPGLKNPGKAKKNNPGQTKKVEKIKTKPAKPADKSKSAVWWQQKVQAPTVKEEVQVVKQPSTAQQSSSATSFWGTTSPEKVKPVYKSSSKTPIKGKDWVCPGVNMPFEWIEDLNCWVGTWEVTNAQYRQYQPSHSSRSLEDSNGKRYSLDGAMQPVVFVSWKDANNFANWLTEKARKEGTITSTMRFTLPSYNEWDKSIRSGTSRRYPWGDSWPPVKGNYSDSTNPSSTRISGYTDGYAVSCNVNEAYKNDWGLYGVGDNVREWTSEKDGPFYQIRGAGWNDRLQGTLSCDSIKRNPPSYSSKDVGFRIVLKY